MRCQPRDGAGVAYDAFFFDPLSGDRLDAGTVGPDAEGR
jgi:hypothetical protein